MIQGTMARVAAATTLLIASAAVHGAHALPPTGPSASVAWSPSYPTPEGAVTFSIDASDPDGSIQEVTLEYGDGQSKTIVTPRSLLGDTTSCVLGGRLTTTTSHAYAATGSFPLTLTVRSGGCPMTGSIQQATTTARYTLKVFGGAAQIQP